MDTFDALNAIGLLVEIAGVVAIGAIDIKERNVLEAQTRLQKAHDAYLQNMSTEMAQHYLGLCNNREDRALVDAYDPRDKRTQFGVALWLLGLGMFSQLIAAVCK